MCYSLSRHMSERRKPIPSDCLSKSGRIKEQVFDSPNSILIELKKKYPRITTIVVGGDLFQALTGIIPKPDDISQSIIQVPMSQTSQGVTQEFEILCRNPIGYLPFFCSPYSATEIRQLIERGLPDTEKIVIRVGVFQGVLYVSNRIMGHITVNATIEVLYERVSFVKALLEESMQEFLSTQANNSTGTSMLFRPGDQAIGPSIDERFIEKLANSRENHHQ